MRIIIYISMIMMVRMKMLNDEVFFLMPCNLCCVLCLSEKRRVHPSSQMEAGSSHQLIGSFPDESAPFESPALFDSFEEVEVHPLDRQRTIKLSSKRHRDGENTRVRSTSLRDFKSVNR